MWNPLESLQRFLYGLVSLRHEQPAERRDDEPEPQPLDLDQAVIGFTAEQFDPSSLVSALEDLIGDADVTLDPITPIEPPQNMFERVIESLSGFAARIGGIPVQGGQTATETIITRVFGRPQSQQQAPQTITQAIRPTGPTGLFARQLNQPGAAGRTATSMAQRLGLTTRNLAGSQVAGAEATSTGLGLLTRAMGVGTMGLIGFVGVLGLAVSGLRTLSRNGVAAAKAVAKYNGELLGAQIGLDVARRQREIEKAFELQDAGVEYLLSVNRLENALEPYKTRLEEVGLQVGTVTNEFVAGAVENPVGAMVDFAIPDGLAMALGLDEMQDAIVQELQEASNAIKAFFGIVQQQHGNDPAARDPLAMHNMLINDAFPGNVPKPLAPQGAAPNR